MTETAVFKLPEILFLDCETSGLYKENLAIDDPQQPWCPQIAAALCTTGGVVTNHFSHLVKADGRKIHPNALKVHGIDDRTASQIGIPESRALGCLTDMLKTAPLDTTMKIVTYGDFDARVIASLLGRLAVSLRKPPVAFDRLWRTRPHTEFVNLMTPYAQQVCRIKSDFDEADFKWPSLDEAAASVLGRKRSSERHDGWEDLVILKDLYFNFRDRGFFGHDAEESAA